MRISDWSSDVCSADLQLPKTARTLIKKGDTGGLVRELQAILNELDYLVPETGGFDTATDRAVKDFQGSHLDKQQQPLKVDRSEERRVGNEWVSTDRSGWSANH